MRAQVVVAEVPAEEREEYLDAWSEWSGLLLPMGIDCELLESEERDGRFVEITWFGEGEEGAMADDRLVRVEARLDRAAAARQGSRELYRVR